MLSTSLQEQVLGLESRTEFANGSLKNFPRPCTVVFVVARSLIHYVRPVLIPKRRILIIKSKNPFGNGRERAQSRSSR